MTYSVLEYLEDLLLATDSEQYQNEETEEDFCFEIPTFVKEQVVL
jgi:hypothetical protein